MIIIGTTGDFFLGSSVNTGFISVRSSSLYSDITSSLGSGFASFLGFSIIFGSIFLATGFSDVKSFPHLKQNLLSFSLAVPHFEQKMESFSCLVPQYPQNKSSFAISFPQFFHLFYYYYLLFFL